ncbi:hypothetical protein [Flavobacterium sp. 5]|uniref:hypothetical protein n=1 Tax=Flavobacterium sp. 5 TaxID=2035199 RepID=UPI000CACCF55|nr:hypothetical protein [Flavobacterium sp. 5]PKB15972.1 hypothetical protein CLU82_1083 [Flavobacterium sp. 5]
MALAKSTQKKIKRDISISLLIYSLPVLAIYLYFKLNNGIVTESHLTLPSFLEFAKPVFANLQTWGLVVLYVGFRIY